MLSRSLAGLAVIVLVACAAPAGQTREPQPADSAREYTAYEFRLSELVQQRALARAAERAYRTSRAAPATAQLLFEANRTDDALRSVEAATRGTADDIVAALRVLSENFWQLTYDASRDYVDRVPGIVALVRARLSTLPREDAARVARSLLGFDAQVELARGSRSDPGQRIAAFVHAFAGTRAGTLAEVDAITSGDDVRARIAALDAFWKAHPASEAGAKALFLKGSTLRGTIAISGTERRGSDPSARFLEVVAIVDELVSGKYPDSEWVRKAPDLVTEFFVSSDPPPAYAPGSVDRMLAEYGRFVRTYFAGDVDPDTGVGYVIATKMADLHAVRGSRVAGVDATLDDLTAHGADRRAVELFRGKYLANQAVEGPEADRPAMQRMAETVLTALADSGTDAYARKASAELAGLLMYQHDYTRALPAFEAYAARFPSSSFTWVARLRAAQCAVELGDLTRAATLYEAAATTYPEEPLSLVLGSALAGRTYDVLQQFDRAQTAHRRALAAWVTDYGPDVTPFVKQASRPSPPTGDASARNAVTQINLADRVASLDRNLRTATGLLLERAASQIDTRKFSDARATLAQARRQAGSADDRAAVRLLDHRAQLEIAMATLAVEGRADAATGLKALDAIQPEPFDTNVGFALLAKATVLFKSGATEQADVLMNATLNAWREAQRSLRSARPASALAADVAALRSVIFKPTGGLRSLTNGSWNAFEFPDALRYAIVNPDVEVTTSDGKARRVTLYQDFPDKTPVIFWTTDDIAFVSRLMVTLGGTARQTPAMVMETPNQPAGAAVAVMNFWNGFFPTSQGHWDGWVLETYPIITDITFQDAARTRALVAVTIGYSGATVVLEKKNGIWVALRLVKEWIT